MKLKTVLSVIGTILAIAVVGCGNTSTTKTYTKNVEGDHPLVLGSSWNGYCGKERAAVKHTVDSAASQINTTPKIVTVDYLVGLPYPNGLSGFNPPRQPEEKQVYTVTATLVLVKHESDGDYHLVLKSDSGKTMIAEAIPSSCANGSPFQSKLAGVRSSVDRFKLPLKVTATGVGFFDFNHGQTGVATNAVELHPLISIVAAK